VTVCPYRPGAHGVLVGQKEHAGGMVDVFRHLHGPAVVEASRFSSRKGSTVQRPFDHVFASLDLRPVRCLHVPELERHGSEAHPFAQRRRVDDHERAGVRWRQRTGGLEARQIDRSWRGCATNGSGAVTRGRARYFLCRAAESRENRPARATTSVMSVQRRALCPLAFPCDVDRAGGLATTAVFEEQRVGKTYHVRVG
jgi:hypothetical protein